MRTRTTYKNQIPLDNSRTQYRFHYTHKKNYNKKYFAINKDKSSAVLRDDAIFKSTNLEVLKNQTIEENLTANIEQSELKETTTRVLSSLTPREERVLRMRFGFSNNTDYTLEEVAQHFKVSRERIRQVEAKALRKLKHPSRSTILKPYLNATSINR